MEVPEGDLHDSVVESPDHNGTQQQRINGVMFAVRHAHTLTCQLSVAAVRGAQARLGAASRAAVDTNNASVPCRYSNPMENRLRA